MTFGMKSSGILVFLMASTALLSCKPEEIILHGDVTGIVTDASTTEPIGAAFVKYSKSNDSARTGSDGTYLLKTLHPGMLRFRLQNSVMLHVQKK